MNASKLLITIVITGLTAACGSGGDENMNTSDTEQPTNADTVPPVEASPAVSPVLKINRNRNRRGDQSRDGERFRTFDGSENNRLTPEMNSAESNLTRVLPSDYGDLSSTLAGDSRPGARAISNTVNAQPESIVNLRSASDFLWQWGQFLDHDLDLTDGVDPAEPANIPIPLGDAWFDPSATGSKSMPFNRSIYDPETGTAAVNPRQQLNEITGWIDASNVYGSDLDRASALRRNDGTGKLRTSAGDLLPFNESGLANAGGPGVELFLAGDVRANEQLGLTAMHTLFVREHNRLAGRIAADNPGLSGDDVYQRARRIVGAQMQVITYEEFLPVLLGEDALRPYAGYDESIDARIANVFSAAAYRLGHSMLSAQILRLDDRGNEISAGHLPLRSAFFSPQTLVNEGGIEPLLRGLAAQVCQRIDVFVIDDVRNFLFGNPDMGGFDLASLNIQRGRDHGLPDYNAARQALGLPIKASFSEISDSAEIQSRLAAAYGTVDDMDLWVAGLAEDTMPGSMLGELFHTIVVRQFEALRDGDRFWYRRALSSDELREVADTTLADIIRRNTTIDDEISDEVFVVE